MKRLYNFVIDSARREETGFKSPLLQKDTEMQAEEMTSQIHHLQTKIAQQNKMKLKASAYQMKHIETKTEENATLLGELNELRINYKKLNSIKTTLAIANGQMTREIKFLHSEVKKLEAQVKGNQLMYESGVENDKENKNQTMPNFKIRSVQTRKGDTVAGLVNEFIINEGRRDSFLEKVPKEEREMVFSRLVQMTGQKNSGS